MRRLSLCVVVAVGALVTASAALADGGPLTVIQGGDGVASHAHPALHYVAVPDGTNGTLVEAIDSAYGGVFGWHRFAGTWGIPALGVTQTGEGLSQDDRTLVLASAGGPYASPTKFLIVDARRMQVIRAVTLHGSYSFDALSPNAAKLYLIEYTSTTDLSHYIVREYDLRTNRLLPGKIADRSEHEETMAGTPITRTTSASGRWVYTLYQKTANDVFVHALDTVGGVAYCIDLPWSSSDGAIYADVLSLRDHGRTLALDARSGRPLLSVAVGTWRISYPTAGVSWTAVGGGIGGALALASVGGLLLWRRRDKELERRSRDTPAHAV
jgi:MYXO-CTERM domain-containing protein